MADKKSFDQLVKEINKEFGEDSLHLGLSKYAYERIPFTSPRLNYVTYGGIPAGKIIEFYGDNHSGKTSTALDVIANYQRMPNAKKVVYCDAENTLDTVWANTLGVDVDSMYIMSPTNQGAETIFQKLIEMIATGEVGVMVIDSLGVMLSNQALEKSIEDKTYGGISMALTNFSKQAAGLCQKYNCTLIGINQQRADLGSPYGGTTTTGGMAWRHNCSVRMEFRQGKYFDNKYKDLSRRADNPIGNYVECYMAKNKTCPPDRHNGFYTLRYDIGVDYLFDLIEVCIEYGFILRKGSWFDIANPDTGEILKQSIQGQSAVKEFLMSNEEVRISLEKAVEDKIIFRG